MNEKNVKKLIKNGNHYINNSNNNKYNQIKIIKFINSLSTKFFSN